MYIVVIIVLACCLAGIYPLGSLAANIEAEPGDTQVQIPLNINLAYDVAGVQFSFSYTGGLSFVEFVQSDATREGTLISPVEKDGETHLGFFAGSNVFVPEGGKLYVGYFLFDYAGSEPQSVVISEIKLVEMDAENNTTNSELIGPYTLTVSRAGGVAPSAEASGSPSTGSSGSGLDIPSAGPGAADESASPVVEVPEDDIAEAANPDGEASSDVSGGVGNAVYLVIAAAVIVVAAIFVLCILRKKGKAGESKKEEKEVESEGEEQVRESEEEEQEQKSEEEE